MNEGVGLLSAPYLMGVKMSALKNYKKWIYQMQLVHEAKYYILKSEELGHPHLWGSYSPILDFLAHFKGALNCYSKCFISAGPGRTRIDAGRIFKFDEVYLEKHNRLIKLRNKYIAHSDVNEFEQVSILEMETSEELVLKLQYEVTFPFDRLYELKELIRLVEIHVIERQHSHLAAVQAEVGKPVRVLEGR